MASEDNRMMECYFEIDTKAAWDNSMTKILGCFQDPTVFVNRSMGFAYVKGKTDPHTILKKLKKGQKHTMLLQLTNIPQGDHQYQASHPYYNSWHNNNSFNHLLLNNAHNQYYGHNNHLRGSLPYRPGELSSIHLHRHDSSSVQSSSTSTSSTSRPVTEPLPSAPSTRRGFIKKVISIRKITRKFRYMLGCVL